MGGPFSTEAPSSHCNVCLQIMHDVHRHLGSLGISQLSPQPSLCKKGQSTGSTASATMAPLALPCPCAFHRGHIKHPAGAGQVGSQAQTQDPVPTHTAPHQPSCTQDTASVPEPAQAVSPWPDCRQHINASAKTWEANEMPKTPLPMDVLLLTYSQDHVYLKTPPSPTRLNCIQQVFKPGRTKH